MDAWTRRKFLRASGVAGAGAIAAGAMGLGLANLLNTASDKSRAAGQLNGTLVVLTLYGGNDGLNTVIPYADRTYHRLRPELAYDPERVLRLDDTLGLNPMLRGLRQLWDTKQLGIVLGVGYPRPDRSHFRSMDIWQTASPKQPASAGWVGRWLDASSAAPEIAVSFEPALPPLLAGETRAGSCVSLDGLVLPAGVTAEMVGSLGGADPTDTPARAWVASAYAGLVQVDRLVREAGEAAGSTDADQGMAIPATGTGGESALARQLAAVARCVEAGVPTRVYSVSLGGFDTHADERAGHETLLRQLDSALTGFVTRMARSLAGQRVTVLVYSEFGRRVRANASDGTDHGTAGPVFVLGSGLTGGLHGEQPSLTDLDDGDLKATVDFRDVLGTVLDSVLDADPIPCLAGYRPTVMPLFATG